MDDSVAVLGHEVRNLLATFVGFTELLMSNEWPREQQLEYLQTMREEGLRVSQFMQQLLDLEHMEGGGLEDSLKPRPVDIAMLLSYAAAIAGHDPNHPVSLRCPPSLPVALVEPDRVQQVLANLLSNARKYTPKGGQIELSARAVRQTIEITVQDDGIGIPSDALPHVFEKFFRVNSPRHRIIPGSGIGLAICREIVEAHGGRIWVESDGEGRGTRFTFSLPMARVSQPAADRSRVNPRRSSRAEGRTPAARAQHALTAGHIKVPV